MALLLELRHVTREFGGGVFSGTPPLIAVEDLTFSISEERPSITAIAGESGSGKTTLARLLLGILLPSSGTVLYEGRNLAKMNRRERREFRRDVQPVFQDPFEAYNPFYSVDHVLNSPITNFKLAGSKAERREMLEEALELVGLVPSETLGRFPHQLSGGQRQRVMVARALLLKPRIILADEPVSMVDASLRATILDSIRQLNRELGISIVYITHDLTTAYQISENIVIMYRGSVVEAGTVERVIKNPKHPYTQLLVESIPQANPDRRWGAEPPQSAFDEEGGASRGCKFADRCPMVMDMCWRERPPMYKLEEHQAALCFLHRDSPVAEDPDVVGVFEQIERFDQPAAV